MLTLQTIILGCTATATALIAGLFYGYSCSVNPGLGRLPDMAYLTAMQSINRAILNPVFFASFIGTAVLLLLSAWMHSGQPISLRFWLLLVAAGVYLIGVLGVTMLGNVPLNDTLDSFALQTATEAEITAQRAAFEVRWNTLHTIRTLASILALVLAVITCLIPKNT